MKHVATNVDRSRSPIVIPFAILGLLSILALCSIGLAMITSSVATAGGTGDAVPIVSNVNATSFVHQGPFGVGETTLTLPGTSTPVEVWYPANASTYHGTPATYNVKNSLPASLHKAYASFAGVIYPSGGISNVPMAAGKYPVVVFSHGYAGFNTQSTYLTSHLASWGFVVAAPEHVDRDLTAVLNGFLTGKTSTAQSNDVADLEATILLMNSETTSSSSLFSNHLDMTRVGAVGHSAGGAAVEKLAVSDKQVDVFIGLAGASYGAFGQSATGAGATVPKVPGLLEYGTNDQVVVPSGMIKAYNALNQPKRLISILNAGHLVFSDICQLAPGQGGLIGVAKQINLPVPASLVPLGSDGCLPPNDTVTKDWPVVNQSVTAQLRWALGFDPTQAGLTGLSAAFPGRVGTNTTAESVPQS